MSQIESSDFFTTRETTSSENTDDSPMYDYQLELQLSQEMLNNLFDRNDESQQDQQEYLINGEQLIVPFNTPRLGKRRRSGSLRTELRIKESIIKLEQVAQEMSFDMQQSDKKIGIE